MKLRVPPTTGQNCVQNILPSIPYIRVEYSSVKISYKFLKSSKPIMFRFGASILVFGMVITACFAGEDVEEDEKNFSMEDVKSKFEDAFSAPVKGVEDFFKNAAGDVQEKVQSTGDTMKEFAKQAQEKSEAGMEAAKGIASEIGDRFSSVKESMEEHGAKMKEAFQAAAEKSKDEFETAASKVSEHAKKASETMFSLFNFN